MATLRGITLSLLAVLYYQSALFANHTDEPLDEHSIDEVMVTTRTVIREVTPVQSLAGESLDRLSVHSVADAARYFSGVQIKDYGGVGGVKTINVRSLGSQHVGVFYDGVEVGNAQNGVVDLGRFSLDNMEELSIYSGQKSAIFQSAKDFASASSIYMKTRRPTFEEDSDYNLKLSLKGGSFETINPSVLWEHKLTQRVRSSLSGEYLYSSGEYPFSYTKADGYDTTQVRENGDVRYLRGEIALFGDIKSGGQWQAKGYIYNSERGYPGAVVREEPGVFKNADRQWDNNIFVQGQMQKRFGDIYSLRVTAKYAYDYLHYLSDPSLDSSTMYVDNTYIQQEVYSSVANLFNISSWMNIAVANDFQFNTLDADLTGFIYPKRYSSLTSLATSIEYGGLRAQASALYSFVHDVTSGESADNLNRVTPTAVISYRPMDSVDLSLRAFYKRIFRMPTLNDLYYTFIGNASLNPEYTNQYNVGVTYRLLPEQCALKELELQADIYYNQVENKIIAMPTSNQFRWTMVNLGYVEIRGSDISAQALWQWGEVYISTRANYTYQKAQDFTDPADESCYGGQIAYTPWHSCSAIIGGDYAGWALNYSFIYTGERYSSSENIAENYSQPWYTSDVSLSKSLPLKRCDLRITAEVNNLLNQQYEVVECYPMPGINFNLKVSISI